jgi:hypothetical protein
VNKIATLVVLAVIIGFGVLVAIGVHNRQAHNREVDRNSCEIAAGIMGTDDDDC